MPIHSHDPIAYTYEAATHCPTCTELRFGVDENRNVPEDATDGEGNGVGVIAPWDTSDWPEGIYCDDCHAEIVPALNEDERKGVNV